MSEKMTVSCGNVFEDFGFPPNEAAAMLARETLLIELEKELRKRGQGKSLSKSLSKEPKSHKK